MGVERGRIEKGKRNGGDNSMRGREKGGIIGEGWGGEIKAEITWVREEENGKRKEKWSERQYERQGERRKVGEKRV